MPDAAKPTVRWRFVSDSVTFTCWTMNGERIIVSPPKPKMKSLEDRVLSLLRMSKRRRAYPAAFTEDPYV